MVRYPGGFHIVRTPSQAVDLTKRVLAWNARHDTRPKRRARQVRLGPAVSGVRDSTRARCST